MLRVINIVNHPPAYDGHRERERPKISWDLPDGNWLGLLGFEWQDKIGDNVMEITNDIIYEVWQPDLRADKVYEHTYKSGLGHKLFPAKKKKYIHGVRIYENWYSKEIIQELKKISLSKEKVILHINAGFRFLNLDILKKFHKRFPIVGQFFTNSKEIFTLPKTSNPLKLHNAYKKRFELNKYYRKIKYIIPSIEEGADLFEKKFDAVVFYRDTYNFGTDFSDWKREKSIKDARITLELPDDKFIIYSSSRLVPVKQIDKLIEVIARIRRDDFIYVIGGKGSPEYEKYLQDLVFNYKLTDKVFFVGYVDYSDSKDYYLAADVVISTSFQEAGPTTPFEAAALEIPMILTDTGIASEFYKKNVVGCIIPTKDYKKWEESIIEVINGKEIKVPVREKLEKFGDWKSISQYYLNVYKMVEKDYYKS